MGTISNSLASTASSSTATSQSSTSGSSANSTGIFTGTSAYSQDFQNVIARAVAIASLPVNLLTNQQTSLTAQSTELSTLDTKFASLQTAIQGIQNALGGSGMQTTVSTPAVATVTVGDGAVEGAYSIDVTNIGAYATSLSTETWNGAQDPSGVATTFNLVVGSNTYSIAPSKNGAATVAAAISSQYGALVSATAVNIGPSTAPDYRISLKSATLGAQDLKLQIPTQANLQWAGTAASGYAISQSTNTWDSSGSASTYTLKVDNTSYTITPTDNSASSVAAALNALSGNPVTATVVDVGDISSHDYRLRIQSNSATTSTVDLQNSLGTSLQQQQTAPAAKLAVSRTAWSWDPTADSTGAATSYTLSIGSAARTFTVNDNSATGLAAAINALAGSPAQATVVDLGTGSNHDYRIQLVSNTAGDATPQLTRSTPFDLQNQGIPPGELAQYQVSNSGLTVSSNTRNVAIAAGTTLTLQATGSTDVTVTRSTSALNSALSSFSDAYNAVFKELESQRGQSGGALQGNSIVNQLTHVLSGISTYALGTGAVSGLASLGLSLGTDGTFTYSPYTLMATDIGNSAGVTSFLGSASGGGFLKAATDALNSVENSTSGMLKNAESDMQTRLTNLAGTIADKQNKVSQLQAQLQDQMAQADAAVATMEQQYSYVNSLFAAMQTSDQMYSKS